MILLFHLGFLEITWIDLVDILLVSLLIYELYQLVKGSVAVRILTGGMALFMLWLLVGAMGMELLSTILGQFIGVGVIAFLILFQQEIRKFLLVIGKANYLNSKNIFRGLWKGTLPQTPVQVDVFVEAAQEMSASLIGALIVFAKSSELKFYAESGDIIDAIASKRVLISIFNKYSPLHDGAVIISSEGRIRAARCILPVSENPNLSAQLGLRHRSAIGLTEVTDAIVLVVSEETGAISLVKNGEINRKLSPETLRQKLLYYLTEQENFETVASTPSEELEKV
jgi:diadenylate cyclase